MGDICQDWESTKNVSFRTNLWRAITQSILKIETRSFLQKWRGRPSESENAKKYFKKFLEVELEFFNYLRFISIAQFGRFYVSFKYSDFITNYNKIPKNIFKYFFAFSDSEGLPLHFCKKDLVSIFKIDWVMTLQRLVRHDHFLTDYQSWQMSPIWNPGITRINNWLW